MNSYLGSLVAVTSLGNMPGTLQRYIDGMVGNLVSQPTGY